jgi:predicted secreted hydrolase
VIYPAPRRLLLLALIVLLISIVAVLSWQSLLPRPALSAPDAMWVVHAMSGPEVAGFERATEPRPFEFPRDHGPHQDFQTEWWYYTGNLESSDGRRWGYQLTFFRRGLARNPPERVSRWATNDVYMAHFALTDVAGRRFYANDHFARGGEMNLAGATAEPFRVFIQNWEARGTGEAPTLRAAADGVAIDLNLRSLKLPALQGESGLSPKSHEVGNASYYYSLTRMVTDGTLTVDGEAIPVKGLSWMDHEWSTSALGGEQVGWDWFALQLEDGRDIMWAQLRREDGSIDMSFGSIIAQDGTLTPLDRSDGELVSLDTWTSPHTGVRYPSRWQLSIPAAKLELIVTPRLADQELRLGVLAYWEGAVSVEGSVAGQGYMELTGYGAFGQSLR